MVLAFGWAKNEAAIRGFAATGKVVVQLPELEAGHVLGGSAITYRSPSDLHVVGRKYGKVVARLTALSDAARGDLGDKLTGSAGGGRREPGRVRDDE